MPTYETMIRNEPLVLLDTIVMLISTHEKAKYPSLTLVEVLCSFLKVKQGENEELLEYLTMFKMERDINFLLLDRGVIDCFTEQLPDDLTEVDDAARKEVKMKELDKLLAVLFLHNANHERFGELLVDYWKAYVNKDIKYPQNVLNMIDIIRQQPLNKKKKDPVKNPKMEKDKDKEGECASSYATMDGK